MPEEEKIIKLKYAGKIFKNMTVPEIQAATKGLLLTIHVITGWTMPGGELLGILIDQFEKKIVESYSKSNAAEIEYAFRNNTEVKDWGKQMNLSLIDEVMIPYLNKRFELSQIEESQRAKKELAAPSYQEISWREIIQKEYEIFLVGKSHPEFWPVSELHKQLIEDKFFSTQSVTTEEKAHDIQVLFLKYKTKGLNIYEPV